MERKPACPQTPNTALDLIESFASIFNEQLVCLMWWLHGYEFVPYLGHTASKAVIFNFYLSRNYAKQAAEIEKNNDLFLVKQIAEQHRPCLPWWCSHCCSVKPSGAHWLLQHCVLPAPLLGCGSDEQSGWGTASHCWCELLENYHYFQHSYSVIPTNNCTADSHKPCYCPSDVFWLWLWGVL